MPSVPNVPAYLVLQPRNGLDSEPTFLKVVSFNDLLDGVYFASLEVQSFGWRVVHDASKSHIRALAAAWQP